jgi:hypothetical protein
VVTAHTSALFFPSLRDTSTLNPVVLATRFPRRDPISQQITLVIRVHMRPVPKRVRLRVPPQWPSALSGRASCISCGAQHVRALLGPCQYRERHKLPRDVLYIDCISSDRNAGHTTECQASESCLGVIRVRRDAFLSSLYRRRSSDLSFISSSVVDHNGCAA